MGLTWKREAYLTRYSDQKETTAKTCVLRNATDGRPRTWSIMVVDANLRRPKLLPLLCYMLSSTRESHHALASRICTCS
jgi:hypothetical protein